MLRSNFQSTNQLSKKTKKLFSLWQNLIFTRSIILILHNPLPFSNITSIRKRFFCRGEETVSYLLIIIFSGPELHQVYLSPYLTILLYVMQLYTLATSYMHKIHPCAQHNFNEIFQTEQNNERRLMFTEIADLAKITLHIRVLFTYMNNQTPATKKIQFLNCFQI